MIKAILTAGLVTASLASAQAGQNVPPAPPTEVYTAPAVTVCNPVSVQVYFRNGEAALSDFALSTLSETRKGLTGCEIARVDLVSLTADGRTDDENITLASERASLVLSALSDEGLIAETISTELDVDADEAVIGRAMARRVDVTLAAYRPDIG